MGKDLVLYRKAASTEYEDRIAFLRQVQAMGLPERLDKDALDLMHQVITQRKMNMRNPQTILRVQMLVLCAINLGLEKASEGDVATAHRLLCKNTPSAFFKIAQAMLGELRTRVRQTLTTAYVVIAKVSRVCLLEPETERQLRTWEKQGFDDEQKIPPTTVKQIGDIEQIIKLACTELALAKRVAWSIVLAPQGQTKFLSKYLHRTSDSADAPQHLTDGPLRIFLKSILIKAVTRHTSFSSKEGVMRNTSSQTHEEITEFVSVTPRELKVFLELLFFDPEEIERRKDEYHGRLYAVAGRITHGNSSSLFIKHFHHQGDFEEQFLPCIQEVFKSLIEDAMEFGCTLRSLDNIDAEDMEVFWHARIMLVSTRVSDERLEFHRARVHSPVQRVQGVKTLHALMNELAMFRTWPQEVQMEVLRAIHWRELLERAPTSQTSNVPGMYIGRAGEDFQSLLSLLAGRPPEVNYFSLAQMYGLHFALIDPNWCVAGRFARIGEYEDDLVIRVGMNVEWKKEHVKLLLQTISGGSIDELLKCAMRSLSTSVLPKEEWQKLLDMTVHPHHLRVAMIVRDAIPSEWRKSMKYRDDLETA